MLTTFILDWGGKGKGLEVSLFEYPPRVEGGADHLYLKKKKGVCLRCPEDERVGFLKRRGGTDDAGCCGTRKRDGQEGSSLLERSKPEEEKGGKHFTFSVEKKEWPRFLCCEQEEKNLERGLSAI